MSFLAGLGAGVALQLGVGLLELGLPRLAGLDPVLRLIPLGVAGALAVRRRRSLPGAVGFGALGAGISGFLGVAGSALLGAPGPLLPRLVSVTGTGAWLGAVAGYFAFSRARGRTPVRPGSDPAPTRV